MPSSACRLAIAVDGVAELARVAAFRIVRAADEGAVLAELQRQIAGAAFRADARVGAVLARREHQRRQFLVQRVEHVGDAQFLDVVDGAGKILPEIAQHVLPGELAVGDLVELFFERGREIVFDIALEEAFQEGRQQPALGLRHQLALVDRHIFAVFERLQGRRVGRRPADAEFFHLLDERRFRIARRRLGRVLGRVDPVAGKLLARHGSPAGGGLPRPPRPLPSGRYRRR